MNGSKGKSGKAGERAGRPITRAWFAPLSAVLMATDAGLGATYFVRVTGSDLSSGLSAATAFATISKAAAVMTAGDVVYVGAGTYNGQVTPAASGTAANPIQYVADSTGAMTGDAGTVKIAVTGSTNYGINVSQKDYCQFIGFQITAGAKQCVNWNRSVGGLLQRCEIKGSTVGGVRVVGSTMTIDGCNIYPVIGDGVNISKYSATNSNVTILSTSIHDTGPVSTPDSAWPVNMYDTSTVTIRSCNIYNFQDDGISINGAGPVINGSETSIHGGLDGTWLGNNATISFVNCLFYDLTEAAVFLTTAGSSATVWNSTFYNIGQDAVRVDNGAATITNCIIDKCGDAGLQRTSGTLTHSYNQFYANGRNYAGTSAGAGEHVGDPKFVTAGSDFHLLSGSPAIDWGTSASAYTLIDMGGGSRPVGAGWDAGCYEYGSSVARPKVISWVEVEPN